MTENAVASDDFVAHTNLFMSKLSDEDSHTRAFACLVIRALINRLSGEHKLEVGLKALKSMGLESIDVMSDFVKGTENVQEVCIF